MLEDLYQILYHFPDTYRRVRRDRIQDAFLKARPRQVVISKWVRIVRFQWSRQPLSAQGSLRGCGGRFNVSKEMEQYGHSWWPAIYIASDYPTAYLEAFGIDDHGEANGLRGTDLALMPAESITTVVLNGLVHNVFDVTRTENLELIAECIKDFPLPKKARDISKELGLKTPSMVRSASTLEKAILHKEWRRWPMQFDLPSPPQIFGRWAHEAGFDGILYNSTKGDGRCLALFPQNWTNSSSWVEVDGHVPEHSTLSRLDSATAPQSYL